MTRSISYCCCVTNYHKFSSLKQHTVSHCFYGSEFRDDLLSPCYRIFQEVAIEISRAGFSSKVYPLVKVCIFKLV